MVINQVVMDFILARLKVKNLNRYLGPAPNAPKCFAAVEMIKLATDKDWLHKATKKIPKF